MLLSTTLKLCREHHACKGQYALLVQALGPDWGDDQLIPLTLLLDLQAEGWTATSNAIWALRAVPAEQRDSRDRVAASWCVDMLGAIPGPPEHTRAVQVLRAFASGLATIEDVQKAVRDAWAAWAAWAARDARAARDAWAARAARDARDARDASVLRFLLEMEAGND